jgi:hypothetical protein
MRNIRFWIPVIIGAVATPVCWYLIGVSAVGSGASGHAGAGMVALLLFYPSPSFSRMLLAGGLSSDAFLSLVMSRLAFAGMLLQFPLYGFIISYAKLKRHWWLRLCAGVVWIHITAIIAGVMVFFIQTWL